MLRFKFTSGNNNCNICRHMWKLIEAELTSMTEIKAPSNGMIQKAEIEVTLKAIYNIVAVT